MVHEIQATYLPFNIFSAPANGHDTLSVDSSHCMYVYFPDVCTHISLKRLSYHARWKRLGLTLETISTTVHEVTPVVLSPQRIEVHVHSTLHCHRSPASAQDNKAGTGTPLLDIRTVYTVYGSKDIHMAVKVVSLYERQATEPLHLPRIGIHLELPKEMHDVSWFGLGPHENYADRKKGALLDVHRAHVKDLYTPYVVPSTCPIFFCSSSSPCYSWSLSTYLII